MNDGMIFRVDIVVLYVLRLCVLTQSEYWSLTNHRSSSATFPDDLGCVSDIQIPDFLHQAPHCDQQCQEKERSYLDNLCKTMSFESLSKDLVICSPQVHHCDWDGVVCLKETKHIIVLDFTNKQIEGICTQGLENLEYLLGFCFEANNCVDNFNTFALQTYNHLLVVNFAENNVGGTVPSTIDVILPRLVKLVLYNTQIKGVLPPEVVNIEALKVLDIGNTGIERKSIPSIVGKLEGLIKLDLTDLGIKGNLNMVKNLSKLEHLGLSGNAFHGCIPEEFGFWLPHLKVLYIERNNISCELPVSIQNISKIEILRFYGNQGLNGLIPKSINSLQKLRVFDISETRISGLEDGVRFRALSSFVAKDCNKFSISIYELKQAFKPCRRVMKYLQIRHSKLRGDLSRLYLDYFPKLTVLDVSENKQVTGGLPVVVEKNINLVRIDVSDCSLTKPLPLRSLRRLTELASLDVRGNAHMRGPVTSPYIKFYYRFLSTVWDGANYECPQIKLKSTDVVLHIDASYFHRQHCVCLNGYYGQGGYCRQCMNGGTCRKNISDYSGPSVKFPVPSVMRVKHGYRPSPSLDHAQYLRRCRAFSLIHDKRYDFVCYLTRTEKGNTSIQSTYCKRNALCPPGYGGKLCLLCLPGHYDLRGRCLQCEGDNIVLGAATISLIFFCATVALWVWCKYDSVPFAVIIIELIVSGFLSAFQIIPGWVAKIYLVMAILSFSGRGTSSKGILKICVVFVQLVEALFFQPTGPFGGPNIVDYILSVFSFRINSIECVLPIRLSVTDKYALNMIFPILVSLIIWIGYGVWSVFKGKKLESSQTMAGYLSRLTIIVFNLSYFPIVQKTLVLFNSCRLDKDDQCRAVDRETWCPEHEKKMVLLLASVGTAFYAIGVPLVFSLLLFKYRQRIKNNCEVISYWLGPLYLPYRHQNSIGMYMEIILILRRLLIAILLVFVSDHVTLQSFLLSIVFLVSIVLETRLKPFKIIQFWEQGEIISKTTDSGKKGTKLGIENIIELAGLSVLLLGVVWIRMPMLARQLERDDLFWVWDVILAMVTCLALIGIVVVLRRLCFGNIKRKIGEKSSLLSILSTNSEHVSSTEANV